MPGPLPRGPQDQARRRCPARPRWPRPRPAACSPPPTRRYWDAARRARGDAAGTRALIEVLLAHRTLPAAALIAAMDRAVSLGRASIPRWCSSTPAATTGAGRASGRRSAHWPATTDRHRLWPPTTTCSPGANHDHHCQADDRRCRRASLDRRRGTRAAPAHRPHRGGPPGRDRRPGTPHPPAATSPKSWPPRSTTAPNGAAPGASTKPSSPGSNGWPTSTSTPSPAIAPATLGHLAAGAYMDAGEPVVLLGDSGTGKSHLLIGLGLAACEQGRRVRYVTTAQLVNELVEAADERRPLPRRRPATAAWTCSASTNSATSKSTPAAPNCCSRSSPNAKNAPRSRSPPTCPSANGAPSSPTPASSPPSSTASPSTPTSSRPAPSPTGYAPAKPPPDAKRAS